MSLSDAVFKSKFAYLKLVSIIKIWTTRLTDSVSFVPNKTSSTSSRARHRHLHHSNQTHSCEHHFCTHRSRKHGVVTRQELRMKKMQFYRYFYVVPGCCLPPATPPISWRLPQLTMNTAGLGMHADKTIVVCRFDTSLCWATFCPSRANL